MNHVVLDLTALLSAWHVLATTTDNHEPCQKSVSPHVLGFIGGAGAMPRMDGTMIARGPIVSRVTTTYLCHMSEHHPDIKMHLK